jgi:hypothetical protein
MNLPARFWAKVAIAGPAECWEWTAALHTKGYGWFSLDGRPRAAHRLALEAALRRQLAEGMMACHTCDNRKCVNPAHLYEGTALDNARDLTARSRVYGEKHHTAKLSDADVAWVRESELRQSTIAWCLGISRSHVSLIRNHRTREART